MEKSRYEKNLFKLNNGYVLEFNVSEEHIFGEQKVIFTSFFNEFSNHYILQTSRNFLTIRRDKERNSIEPYIKSVENKSISNKKLFSKCLENIEKMVQEDKVSEKEFSKKENCINKNIQDYFYEDLYTFIQNPIFNEYIN
ncbi:hypothetical protein M0R19_06890 [Candidatus Pacearchaeota archaeon]|nr:hypothetical protein [Candidatus Pacearchaeota archaeon]